VKLNPAPDEQLIRALCSGRGAAFAVLFARHRLGLYNYVLRLCGRSHDAEELTQEAFLRMLRHCRTFRGDSTLKTWLWAIATNMARDRLRRRKADRQHRDPSEILDNRPANPSSEPEAAALSTERARQVRHALMQLPEDERIVVVLRHYEGMKFAQIAGMLDIPESTAKSRMRYAFEKLERILKPLMSS